MKKAFTIILFGLMALFGSSQAGAFEKTVDGYKIDQCQPYLTEDGELMEQIEGSFDDFKPLPNFCDKKIVNLYKKFGVKNINFNKKYVLTWINNYHLVAINPKNKTVFVFPSIVTGLIDDNGKPTKGQITFNKTRKDVCAVGISFFKTYYWSGMTPKPTDTHTICHEFIDEKEGFSGIVRQKPIKRGKS